MNNQSQNYSKCSHLRLISKNTENRHSSEVLSKYFMPTVSLDCSTYNLDIPNKENSEETECPYEDVITNIDNVKINNTSVEDNDFRTPKHTMKQTVVHSTIVKHKKVQKRCKKTTKQTIPKAFRTLDVNPEHLQLALALSISEQAQTETDKNKIADLSRTVNQTLEQFGFTSGSGRNKRDVCRSGLPIKRRNKKSKYQFVTPILFLRTESDRQQLISEKISLILYENCNTDSIISRTEEYNSTLLSHNLKKYWNKDAHIFKIGGADFAKEETNNIFYLQNISSISPTYTRCGVLLRDWNTIPGRAISPTLPDTIFEDVSSVKNTNTGDPDITKNVTVYRCISPDLFESDEENINESTILLPVTNNKFQLNLECDSPKSSFPTNNNISVETSKISFVEHKEMENHILTIESYSKNEEELAKICLDIESKEEVMDLTQSSDDEDLLMYSTSRCNIARRSSTLNITDYVNSILNQKEETFDLTQNSPEPGVVQEEENEIDINSIKYKKDYSFELDDIRNRDEFEPNISIVNQSLNHDIASPKTPTIYNIPDIDNDPEDHPPNCSEMPNLKTPKNKITIKTSNITPIMDYNEMPTPDIQKQLTKYGIKPFKRSKGIKILTHIYEMTHPVGSQMLSVSDDEDERLLKKRKSDTSPRSKRSIKKYKSEPCIKPTYSTKTTMCDDIQVLSEEDVDNSEFVTETQSSEFNFIGNEEIEILENSSMEVDPDSLIFETIQSRKIASCRVPFHIIFHNLVSSNRMLGEKILLYEPFSSADLYKALHTLGYRFGLQDIENFLHKKCITIKTKQSHTFGKPRKRKPKKTSQEL